MAFVWRQHPILQPPTDAEMAVMEPKQLVELHTLYHSAIANSERDPYRYGFILDNWKRCEQLLAEHDAVVALGGNRCVSGDTIIFDPVAGNYLPISARFGPFHVLAWDGKKLVNAPCSAPFTKGTEPMLQFQVGPSLATCGLHSFKCTVNHRLMKSDGRWVNAGSLSVGDKLLAPWGELREVSIEAITQQREELVYDITVPDYENYWAAGVIHHNSGKTQFGAWQTIKCAMANEGSLIVCFAQNAELSVLVQQAAIFHHLPAEYKQKTLGQDEYISYTKQNGFAGNSLIFPNGSRILFKTYSQYTQNQTVLEGLELGAFSPNVVNLGAWCDEYLGGPELVDTLAFRLATRNSKMLLTFTPIEGYSETVRQFLDGAKTIETKNAELLNNRALPYVQECSGRDAAIIYLHTKDNPFSGYERVAKEALAKGDESWILCRVYGVPTKSISSKFPCFSRETNVVKHEDIPWVKDPEANPCTLYQILDPAGRKKWFMAWIAVDATDTWWVYREWPDASHGDWAEWRNGKWGAGEGAKRDGQIEGVQQYVSLITTLEAEYRENMMERLIDPRLGAAKYQGATGASSIIDDLADAGLAFVPAPGLDIEDGLQALQNKMAYNRKLPLDGSNRPRFYISDRCENIIRSIQEYTGDGGKDEAWKDPLDCVRYAAIADIRHVDPKWLGAMKQSGGSY